VASAVAAAGGARPALDCWGPAGCRHARMRFAVSADLTLAALAPALCHACRWALAPWAASSSRTLLSWGWPAVSTAWHTAWCTAMLYRRVYTACGTPLPDLLCCPQSQPRDLPPLPPTRPYPAPHPAPTLPLTLCHCRPLPLQVRAAS
jgi:hypothetical protein